MVPVHGSTLMITSFKLAVGFQLLSVDLFKGEMGGMFSIKMHIIFGAHQLPHRRGWKTEFHRNSIAAGF